MKHYQAVVVGGGIVGAGIFRDLSLHGINTLLIDKNDFSSQTSQKSSKMLHGGIRYLENMDFKLVFEALHEKNIWLKMTPHLTREVPLHLPVYKDSKRPLWMIHVGLFIYDLLSKFKNSPFKIKNAHETLESIPQLKAIDLRGSGVYFDGIMDDAKITLEVIYDGLFEKNAEAKSYMELLDVNISEGLNILKVRDITNNTIEQISCDQIIYALGPHTDAFLKKIAVYRWQNVLLPSKGSHLWIASRDLPIKFPIVITTKDNRVIFVIPHEDFVLVGTTEVEMDGDFDNVIASESEINYLLQAIQDYFPTLNLDRSHIISTFAGIRPLIKEDGADRGKTSREHKIFQPLEQTYVIAGGKYTTFRIMGVEITKEICHKHGIAYNEDLSLNPLRQKSIVLPFNWKLPTQEELITICKKEFPTTFQDLVQRRLSISNRRMWQLRAPETNFDQYFSANLLELSKYIKMTADDIKSFL